MAPRAIRVVLTSEFDGGAEAYVRRLAVALLGRGREVQLLGGLPRWPDSVPCTDLGAGPKWRLKSLPGGLLRLGRELARLRSVVERRPDLVFNLHFKREQIGYSGLLARRGRLVWTEHGRFPRGLFGALLTLPYRLASRRVSHIICVSEVVRDDIARRVSPRARSRVSVVDTGIDTMAFSPPTEDVRAASRERLGISGDRLVVAFVSRLEAGKRPQLAVESCSIAGALLLVAGSGSLDSAIAAQRAEGRLLFLGHVDDPRQVYYAADVALFLSTGAGEGFPTVLLEAAACGLPVVTAKGHGFERSVIDAGGVVTDDSAHAVAESLTEFARDRARLVRARKEARAWALGRDAATWVSRYEQALVGRGQ